MTTECNRVTCYKTTTTSTAKTACCVCPSRRPAPPRHNPALFTAALMGASLNLPSVCQPGSSVTQIQTRVTTPIRRTRTIRTTSSWLSRTLGEAERPGSCDRKGTTGVENLPAEYHGVFPHREFLCGLAVGR